MCTKLYTCSDTVLFEDSFCLIGNVYCKPRITDDTFFYKA